MTGNETAPQIWHYAAGKWTQASDSLEWDDHNQTWPGFTRSAAMGFAIPEVEIYESTDGDRWRLGRGGPLARPARPARPGGSMTRVFAFLWIGWAAWFAVVEGLAFARGTAAVAR